jgi:hypothetical protein
MDGKSNAFFVNFGFSKVNFGSGVLDPLPVKPFLYLSIIY